MPAMSGMAAMIASARLLMLLMMMTMVAMVIMPLASIFHRVHLAPRLPLSARSCPWSFGHYSPSSRWKVKSMSTMDSDPRSGSAANWRKGAPRRA